ncbi:hypothetical protein, partial [Gluconobacter kondonii]|uniref:hypothetical protein n=1 Tax=Gluconobacter kondonii TaxID=941463 RepID=UPI00222E434E
NCVGCLLLNTAQIGREPEVIQNRVGVGIRANAQPEARTSVAAKVAQHVPPAGEHSGAMRDGGVSFC